ncbi:GEVED domain-containing protein, partial [Flavobacterium sp. SUN052]|uniref:GEVED domain-containing protein n=1 Tax=Flavobacterium sp. SUN052 TaxID=3002441 RepID=UPI00237EDDFE
MMNNYNSLNYRKNSKFSSQEPEVVGNAPNSYGKMRNSWLLSLLVLFLFSFGNGYGQIGSYSFANTNTAYSTIVGGSGTTAVTIASMDDGISAAQTIPFTFNFGGNNFTTFKINSNGWLNIGALSTSTTNYSALGGTDNNVISAFNRDLNGNNTTATTYYVQTVGTSPNRITKIEWANIKSFSSTINPNTGNFQIWLYETSNVVEIHYGAFTSSSGRTSAGTVQVGLRGATTGTADVRSLSNTASWSTPTVGNSSASTNALGTFAAPFLPDSGRTYTFTPPTPCTGTPTPGTIASNLNACSGSAPGAVAITGFSTGVSGIAFQWEQSDTNNGIDWTNAVGGSGATTSSYTPPALTATRYYRAKVTCTPSTLFAYTNVLTFAIANCDYNVTRTTGITYNSIGTSGTGLTGFTSLDDSSSSATNIGFNFFYKGTTFTQFVANTNGFLGLGTSTSSSYTNGLGTGTNIIAPYWDDLYVTGGGSTASISNFIKYQLNGVAPNRVLTVEWIGMEQFLNAGPNINFQVKLYETTNRIEIVHGQMQTFDGSTGTGSAYSYSVGLAGPSGTGTFRTLALVGENSNSFSSTDPATLSIPPACNVTYTFDTAVAYTGSTTFTYVVPSNDNPAGAISLPVNASPAQNLCGTYFNSNLATASPQTSSCTTAPDDDVWFSFVAPASGQVLVSVKSASGNDAVVSLTDASFVELPTFGCVNSFGNALTESLSPTGLTPGATYYARVSNNGVGSGNRSGFSISVSDSFIPPPVNDNPCGAIVLTPASTCVPYSDTTHGISGSTNVTGATTTTSNGVTTPTQTGALPNVSDVWFKFTATSDYHGITVTPVPGFDVAIQAYSINAGTSCPTTLTLTSLGTVNGAGSGSAENVQFATVIGTDYYLRIFRHPSGIAGTPVNDSQFSVCVFNPTPACVVNTSPANLATAVSATPTLTWPTTSFASSYDVYLGTSSGPTTLLTTVASILGATTYSYTLTAPQTLNELTTYYWYVTPKNAVGSAPCGAANQTSFTTAVIPVVLTSATPTSLCLGGSDASRTVVITGSGFTGSTSVQFGTTNAQTFTVDSATQITAVVAASNPAGSSTIKVTKPTANATSSFTIALNALPTVAAITGGSALCLPDTLVLSSTTPGGVWASTNTSVATVSGGTVTGVTVGQTTITYTVTDNGCSTTVSQIVDVRSPIANVSYPLNVNALTGTTATFSSSASGTGVTFVWQESLDGGTVYNDITIAAPYSVATTTSGSIVTSTLSIASVTSADTPAGFNGRNYRARILATSPCLDILDDSLGTAYLAVGNTGIAQAPVSNSPGICDSGSTSFSVLASGDVDAFHWFLDRNDGNLPVAITNGLVADGITYTISAFDSTPASFGNLNSTLSLNGVSYTNSVNGYLYYVVVQGPAQSPSTQSTPATLNVGQGVSIPSLGQPTSVVTCKPFGAATSSAVFTVAPEGSLGTTQWQVLVGSTWTNVGPLGLSLTVNLTSANAAGVTSYRAIVNGQGSCTPVTSDVVTLTLTQPTITVSPSSASYCTPGSAVSLTANGASTYTWSPAAGLSATTGSTVLASPSSTTTYTVTGTDASGCISTATVTITTGPSFSASVTATPSSLCTGLSSQLQAVTPVAPSTVDYYSFSAGSQTYADLVGGTSSTAAGDDGTQNTIAIGFPFTYNGASFTTFSISTNGTIVLGGTATSWTNALASNANVIAPFWDDNNLSAGSIKYSTTGTAPNRVLTVEWKNISIGGSGSTGASTNKFQLRLFEGSNVVKYYYGGLDATNGISASIGISGATGKYLSVTPLSPVSTSTVSSTTENSNITSVANIPSGTVYTFTPPVIPTYTYAWTPSTGLSSTTIANPVASNITSTVVYTCLVTNNSGCSTSASQTITVTSDAVIATQPAAPAPICQGGTTSFTVAATGPGLTYQWMLNGANITGANSATYTITGATVAQSGSYTVLVTPSCGTTATSTPVSLVVNPTPTATAIAAQNSCFGAPTAPIALTGTPSGVTFDVTGGSAIGLADQLGVTSIPSFTPSTFGSATITVTPKANGCSGTSITFVYTINPKPSAMTVTPATVANCSNDAPILLTANGGIVPPSAYCTPTVGSTGLTSDNITNVTFAGINNTTGDGPGDYNYYTATATVTAGVATPISITPNAAFGQQFRVWIDMNQNGTFESTESVFATVASSTVTVNGSITVPTTAFNGTTRMRVADKYSSSILATEACSHTGFGEFEDYNIIISGATNRVPLAVWTSTNGGLFTDAAGTTAYTGTASTTVYARPTLTSTITATVTTAAGCSNSASAVITVTTATSWYADVDGDLFGNPAVMVMACSQPTGYVANNTDCNDNQLQYADLDADGFGSTTLVACGVTNNTDCNDNQLRYTDADADGFGVLPLVACGGVLNNTDCNDNELRYADLDADGFGSTTLVACGGVTNNTDCNDNQVRYLDADGDGYGSVAMIKVACGGSLVATDCDDAKASTNPGAVDVCYDAIDNDCNGNVDNVGMPGGCTPKVANLPTTTCGSTVSALNTVVSAVNVPGAQAFRFKITNMTTNTVQVLDSPSISFQFMNLPGVTFATQYKIEVAIKFAGVWQGFYGSPCFVNTPSPVSIISAAQCGSTLTSMSQYINSSYVANVTGYRYEVTNQSNGQTQYVYSSLNKF